MPLPPQAGLFGIIFNHLLHQLLEDTHLCPPLEAVVNHAGAHTEPILVNGLPLASAPKDVPDAVYHRSITSPRPAASLGSLPLLLGQALFEFSPEGSWEAKVIDALLGCVRLFHKRHLLRER